MAAGYRMSNGVDLDDVFEPRTTAPVAAVGYRDISGVDLSNRYEKLSSGAPATGFRVVGGTDFSQIWAAKGSVSYALSINGGSYTANNQARGTAMIRFQLFNDGTFQVLRAQTNSGFTVVASGTWLPAGDAAGNWTVRYEAVELGSDHIGSGANSGVENQATAQVGTASNPYCSGSCVTTFTGTNSQSHGYMKIYLYRAGVLRSTTTISYFCNVNGN